MGEVILAGMLATEHKANETNISEEVSHPVPAFHVIFVIKSSLACDSASLMLLRTGVWRLALEDHEMC